MREPCTTYTSSRLDYDPFGMLTVGRSWSAGSEYRYGFNGKESDPETYGDGNIYDYGFRIYDPRIGRFLSVDPLTKTFPFFTPYQFASNSPLFYVDLDGLEGVSYYEYTLVDGQEVVLRRVIEVDVYVGISHVKKTADSNGSFYVQNDEKKIDKFEYDQKKMLEKQLNQKGLIDPDKVGENIPLVFKVNVYTFNINEKSAKDKRNELARDNNNLVTDVVDSRLGTRGVVFVQENMGQWTFNELTEKISGPPGLTDGTTDQNIITINTNALDHSHTSTHELSHFLTQGHPDINITDMGGDKSKHAAAGGIFIYGEANWYPNQVTNGGEEKGKLRMDGTQNFNQGNANQVLKSVIKTQDKQVQQQ